MIDRELVTRKIVLITGDLRGIERLSREPRDDFLASHVSVAASERYLERMIGRMIDINYHLVTESDNPPPADYYQSFVELGRLGALDRAFARRIAAAAGLRNRIVHEYEEIDEARIYDALQNALADVPEYLRQVNEFLNKLRGDTGGDRVR